MIDKTPEEVLALAKRCGATEALHSFLDGPTRQMIDEESTYEFTQEKLQAFAATLTAAQPAPMVDMGPPATSRDRWMYEQGRLAERDPRTPKPAQPVQPASLPPLPSPTWMMPVGMAGKWDVPGAFTSEQMLQYARTALAQPVQPALDACQQCHGSRGGGVKGNEVMFSGKVLCDYCHADTMPDAAQPAALPALEDLMSIQKQLDDLCATEHADRSHYIRNARAIRDKLARFLEEAHTQPAALPKSAALTAAQEPTEIENRCVRELRDYAKAHPEAVIFTGWYGHRVTKYLSQPAASPVHRDFRVTETVLSQPAALPAYDVDAAMARLYAAHLHLLQEAMRAELLAAAASKT